MSGKAVGEQVYRWLWFPQKSALSPCLGKVSAFVQESVATQQHPQFRHKIHRKSEKSLKFKTFATNGRLDGKISYVLLTCLHLQYYLWWRHSNISEVTFWKFHAFHRFNLCWNTRKIWYDEFLINIKTFNKVRAFLILRLFF